MSEEDKNNENVFNPHSNIFSGVKTQEQLNNNHDTDTEQKPNTTGTPKKLNIVRHNNKKPVAPVENSPPASSTSTTQETQPVKLSIVRKNKLNPNSVVPRKIKVVKRTNTQPILTTPILPIEISQNTTTEEEQPKE